MLWPVETLNLSALSSWTCCSASSCLRSASNSASAACACALNLRCSSLSARCAATATCLDSSAARRFRSCSSLSRSAFLSASATLRSPSAFISSAERASILACCSSIRAAISPISRDCSGPTPLKSGATTSTIPSSLAAWSSQSASISIVGNADSSLRYVFKKCEASPLTGRLRSDDAARSLTCTTFMGSTSSSRNVISTASSTSKAIFVGWPTWSRMRLRASVGTSNRSHSFASPCTRWSRISFL
mmetsp:Transcript_27619/g.74433  ORF Transcript_27619/g.74433 Transcript_27619/m.74433 type:complete len:246 (-) Transcript_27619:2391-3128(-)